MTSKRVVQPDLAIVAPGMYDYIPGGLKISLGQAKKLQRDKGLKKLTLRDAIRKHLNDNYPMLRVKNITSGPLGMSFLIEMESKEDARRRSADASDSGKN